MSGLFHEFTTEPAADQNSFSNNAGVYDEKLDKLKELFDLKNLSETDYEEKKKKTFMKYEYRKVFHLSA